MEKKNDDAMQLGRPERWEYTREELGRQIGRTVNENSDKEAVFKERERETETAVLCRDWNVANSLILG